MISVGIFFACASIITANASLVHAESTVSRRPIDTSDKLILVHASDVGSPLVATAPVSFDRKVGHSPQDMKSAKYLNDVAELYSRQFENVEPDIFAKDITASNLLFRAGILAIKPNPLPLITTFAEEFVKLYEAKHGKVAGDMRTAGQKLLHFSIEGLFLKATEEHLDYQTRFETEFRMYRAQHET